MPSPKSHDHDRQHTRTLSPLVLVHVLATGLYFAGDLGIINLGSSLFTMKLQAFGAALILLLLTCSFGGHARVAPHVQSLYKTIEAKQRPVGDIWSDCSESMHEFIYQVHAVNNLNI